MDCAPRAQVLMSEAVQLGVTIDAPRSGDHAARAPRADDGRRIPSGDRADLLAEHGGHLWDVLASRCRPLR